jgi:hypothetical protein
MRMAHKPGAQNIEYAQSDEGRTSSQAAAKNPRKQKRGCQLLLRSLLSGVRMSPRLFYTNTGCLRLVQ